MRLPVLAYVTSWNVRPSDVAGDSNRVVRAASNAFLSDDEGLSGRYLAGLSIRSAGAPAVADGTSSGRYASPLGLSARNAGNPSRIAARVTAGASAVPTEVTTFCPPTFAFPVIVSGNPNWSTCDVLTLSVVRWRAPATFGSTPLASRVNSTRS